MKSKCGFTLIEMLVTIAILAIVLAIGIPSFQAIMANAQIKTAAQGIHDGLQLARAEAIRLNSRVIFLKNTQSGWTVKQESNNITLQSRPYKEGSSSSTVSVTPSNATQITFNGLGRVVSNTDATSSITQFDIDVPTSVLPASSSKDLRVTVSSAGSIRLCDPNYTAGVGRGC